MHQHLYDDFDPRGSFFSVKDDAVTTKLHKANKGLLVQISGELAKQFPQTVLFFLTWTPTSSGVLVAEPTWT